MSDIDVRALRYFSAVVQFGSYSEAATHLGISQPAVSRQVLELERSLGTRLLRREGRELSMTETGAALYDKAQKILSDIDSLPETLGMASLEPRGRIAVGLSTALAEYLMPRVMETFVHRYPQVEVRLLQSYSSDLMQMLVAGRIDIAVFYGRPRHSKFEVHSMMDLELGLIIPAKGPLFERFAERPNIALRELAGLPLILPSPVQDLRRMIEDAFTGIKLAPRMVMEVDGVALMKGLVRASLGATILAYNAVHREVQQRQLAFIPIVEPALNWPIYIARRQLKPETPALKVMLREIAEAVAIGHEEGVWRGRLMCRAQAQTRRE